MTMEYIAFQSVVIRGDFILLRSLLVFSEALINKHSCKGDIVLDCCIGSGTTAIACIQENRNFIGFETNREFYDKANKRIENELMIKQDRLFSNES